MILVIISAFIMVAGTLLSVAKIPMHLGTGYVLPTLYDAKVAWVMTHSLTPQTLSQFAVPADAIEIGRGVLGAFFVILFGSQSPLVNLIIHIPTILWIFLYFVGFVHFFRSSVIKAALMVAAALTLSVSALFYFLLLGLGLLLFWRIPLRRGARLLGLALTLGILINPFLLGVAR